MAGLFNYPPSSSDSHSPHRNSPLSSRMYDLPEEYSSAQLEAQRILRHLLADLRDPDSKYYPRYGKWAERHPRLDDFCFRCVRPQTWTFLSSPRLSLDALKLIGGDLRFEGRAVYCNGILGLDRRLRVYVGQANSLRARFAQHLNFRYRRDNPSLHYHALQASSFNTFAMLALLPSSNLGNHALPGMDMPDLLLNLLEMWMALVFRVLPAETLEMWLPQGLPDRLVGKEGEIGGLNIATPLDHGEKQREWVDLSESSDPVVRDYLGLGRKDSIMQDRQRGDLTFVKNEVKREESEVRGRQGGDEVEQRKKTYAEKARRMNSKPQLQLEAPGMGTVVVVAMAVCVGVFVYNSRSAPSLRR